LGEIYPSVFGEHIISMNITTRKDDETYAYSLQELEENYAFTYYRGNIPPTCKEKAIRTFPFPHDLLCMFNFTMCIMKLIGGGDILKMWG
jgi:hypothetical protein